MNINKILINSSIFKDYDIRGIYPKEVNEDTYYILGKALCQYLQVECIAVGRDTRLSSPMLMDSLIKGIIEQGVDVVDLGLISTEMHYFASGKYHFPANIIVSASHNPPEYNGLKIVTKGVVALHGGFGLPEVKKFALDQNFPFSSRKGDITKKDILEDWIKHACSFIDVSTLSKLKVVIDAGNGMGGIAWEKISASIPVEIIPLYFEPDGHFPHHLPDPLKEENLRDIKREVIQNHADLGFALDGDADRLFLLDEKGQIVSGTITTAILASAILNKYKKGIVLYNAVCGRIVPQTILKNGGIPKRVRVGHSYIKQYMKETNATFAGEHSGHFYYGQNFTADSSLITGLLILEYLSSAHQPLSSVVSSFDIYPSSGEINFYSENQEEVMEKIEQSFTDAKQTDHIDGLSVWYPTWWFNLRASKTEPLLRLNLEADSNKLLTEKLELIKEKLKQMSCVER